MAYGLDSRPFLESGPGIHLERARHARAARTARIWRRLDEERRLALVDKALASHANDDLPDGLPIAL